MGQFFYRKIHGNTVIIATSDALKYIEKNKIAPQYILQSVNYPASDNFGFLKQLEILNVNKKNVTICILSTLLLPTDIEKLKNRY